MDDKLMKKVSKLGLADWCAEIENVDPCRRFLDG